MVKIREHRGTEVLDFIDLEDWEDFDKIFDILKKKFTIELVEQIDGPESRVWIMTIDGLDFSLHNNPYGNYLKPRGKESESFLQKMTPLLMQFFY